MHTGKLTADWFASTEINHAAITEALTLITGTNTVTANADGYMAIAGGGTGN